MLRRSLLISGLLVTILQIGILPAAGFAQVEEKWVRRYDGESLDDRPVGVGVDAAGNAYVAGSSQNSNDTSEIVILKYNPNGNSEWLRPYSLPDKSQIASAMAVDNAGNVYVTGTIQNATQDIVTLMYDTNGNLLWVKFYAGAADPNISIGPDDTPAGIAVDGNGNVCVVGHSDFPNDSTDFVALKYDAAGNEVWAAKQRFDGGAATDIAIDVSGNVYLGGYAYFTRGGFDYLAIKYDAAGRLRWWNNWDVDGGGDFAYAIAVDAAANVYLAGEVTFFDESDHGFEINPGFGTAKIDSTGQPLWLRGEGTNFSDADESASDVAVDAQGNIYVTGFAEWAPGNIDFLTVKYDTEQNRVWIRNYDSPGSVLDAASKLVIDSAGNVYVTGISTRVINGFNNDDYVTLKYDNAGNERWVMRYNGPGNNNDIPSGLTVDANGNVYVTGYETGTGTGLDFATIKYNQSGQTTPPLKAVASYPLSSDKEVDIAIVVGDSANPVMNLFGVSFVARYDPQQLRVVIVLPGDFLGVNLPIWFTNVDSTAGKISIGMSRAGVPDGVSGTGTVALVRLGVASSANIGSITQIVIEEIAANDPHGNPIALAPQAADIVVDVEKEQAKPERFALSQNYPNPFNPETEIRFALPRASHVALKIYNMLGQEIRTLVDADYGAGYHSVRWDGRDKNERAVASGIYLYHLQAGRFSQARKMSLVR